MCHCYLNTSQPHHKMLVHPTTLLKIEWWKLNWMVEMKKLEKRPQWTIHCLFWLYIVKCWIIVYVPNKQLDKEELFGANFHLFTLDVFYCALFCWFWSSMEELIKNFSPLLCRFFFPNSLPPNKSQVPHLISSFLRAWLKNLSSSEGNAEMSLPLTKSCKDWMPWPFLLRPTGLGLSSCARLMPDPMISWLHDTNNIQAGGKRVHL